MAKAPQKDTGTDKAGASAPAKSASKEVVGSITSVGGTKVDVIRHKTMTFMRPVPKKK